MKEPVQSEVEYKKQNKINSSEVEYKRQNKIRRKKHEIKEQKECKEKDEASFRVEEKKWKRRIKTIKRYKALSH